MSLVAYNHSTVQYPLELLLPWQNRRMLIMLLKYLGQQLGFSELQADVRIAQYEKSSRSPKENYLNALVM